MVSSCHWRFPGVIMRSNSFRLADLLVGVLAVLLGAALVLSKEPLAQETQRRIKCASNLRMIGQAMLLYANENRGAYPRVLYDKKDANPKPTWGTPYEGNKDFGSAKEADPFAKDQDAATKARPAMNDVTAA